MNLLAFDTSTDTVSIAVQAGDAVWQHTGPGGSQASATLIPAIRSLLAQAGMSFSTLDAIVFGRGPGSFTGLRTACAVAQGLAFGARGGAGVPVLPVDTLLAVAEEARHQHGCTQVVAVLDARMDEVYVAHCEWLPAQGGTAGHWRTDGDFGLCAPEAMQVAAGLTVAGNAQHVYPELLAPAGDMDCARAAVANGADAIYFGLDRFNARLRADNFTLDSLPELMRFLHAHGVKGYVTMNTLIFTSELADALSYLGHLNAAGADGVIVQDIGLARCLTEWGRQVPGMKLELHASTQMTLSSPDGLEFASGFLDLKQAVLARELSLKEIGQCVRHTDIPLEVFVHGALCVAYSGQCLTSESLGQRSANRGECAQACRLPYSLVVDGKAVPLGERRYLLSPQDLCAIDRIPDLVRMGVKSYKIEGRLKSPEYVAAVTAAYRKALDAACAGIPVKEMVTAHDRYALQMVFSRGFSTGWLDGTDHPRLTHGRYGKKRGAYAGVIMNSGQGWLDIRPEGGIPLAPGDGFVIDAGEDRNEEQGGRIWKVQRNRLFFHGKASRIDWSRVRPGQKLWKTDDPALNAELKKMREHLLEASVPLHLTCTGSAGEPLTVSCPEYGCSVQSAQPLQTAEKRPLTPEALKQQLGRLGGTGFRLASCECRLPNGLMLPLSILNQARRALVEQIQTARQEKESRRFDLRGIFCQYCVD